MCLAKRLLATGELVEHQCPKVAITPDSWIHRFGQIGKQYPEMTLAEFAKQAKMSLIDVLRNIVRKEENPDWVPKPGTIYQTSDARTHIVAWADIFAVHWEGNHFSLYSDIHGMINEGVT
jgi:hypothetical protein